jgi:predicted Zn-dependent protease
MPARPHTLLFLSLLLFICGCLSSEYNVATHKQDIYFYSTDKEVNLGRNVSKAVEKEYDMVKDPRVTRRIYEIGKRIEEVCERREINYVFDVIDKDDLNAVSLPGGWVYLFRGLVDACENDDQVAFVVAHEVGHIVARHHIKKLQAALGYSVLLLASSQMKTSGNINQAQGIDLIFATLMTGWSQEDEFLADALAVEYTQEAGFDAKEGIEVLKKLKDAGKKEIRRMTYFRSHPFIPQRISRIKQALGLKMEFKDILNYE